MSAAVSNEARPRALVVEDDADLLRIVNELLTRDGIDVMGVRTGADALDAVSTEEPDVVLLDLGLPDSNGFDLLRELRSRHHVPILVLSARADEADRVLALELGADDYVVKPFLSRELVARVRVRLRRPPAHTPASEALGTQGLQLDPVSREVAVDGEMVVLTAKEFDLLHFLMDSPRQVFSRAQLLDAVWQSSSEWQNQNTVTEHVHRLRQKVGSRRITTVRGVGYRFDPDPADATD